jgi:hypothetical protein
MLVLKTEIMEEQFEHLVYSRNVIEFVTVGREFCNWLETSQEQDGKTFTGIALKILPLMYLKASVLPKSENMLDDFLESFVTEEDYEFVKHQVLVKMGRFDDYLEVFTADMQRSDVPLTSTVSENMADIYQDVKNFLLNYRTAATEIMNDALVELIRQFELYWGQRLVNVLRALHQVYYSGEAFDDEDEVEEDGIKDEKNASEKENWIISQRQKDWQNGLFSGRKSEE